MWISQGTSSGLRRSGSGVDELFADTRVRRLADARLETLKRAKTLAWRAGLSEAASAISAEIERRVASPDDNS